MLEIGIIICVALILFLLIRNFPLDETETLIHKESKLKKFLSNLFKKRREKMEQNIMKSLDNSAELISPREIEDAKESYDTQDPEIAKLLHEANEACEIGDFDCVEEKSLEAIGKDKRCDQAYVFIAKVALSKHQLSDAREALEMSLKCNSDNAMAHATLGEIFLEQEKFTDSIIHFQKAVNIERNNPVFRAGLGKAYMMVRQYSKAAKSLKRAASLDIDNKEYKELALEAEEKQRSHAQGLSHRS